MNQKWVLGCKVVVFAFFLVASPLQLNPFEHDQMIHFATQLFSQNRMMPQIDITKTMNVMDVVRKEDIPYREIDTMMQTPVPEVPLAPSLGQSIYIYSTHQKEMYSDQKSVVEASQVFAEKLKERGVSVVVEGQDFTQLLNQQGLDYNDSYLISRNALHDALVASGGFDMIIDFHRDSLPRELTFLEKENKNYAKLMCVLGNLSGHFPKIKERANLLFDKSNEQLNGIMKPILVREAYYNQDMSENMMLIEVGSDQNTFEEVVNSLDILVEAVIASLG